MIDKSYDEKLKDIAIYKLHETLIPFIGGNYDKHRILHIGESHFLSQTFESEKYNAAFFFDNWWDKQCEEVLNDSPGYVDTRHVIENNYLAGKSGSYGIFTNVVKSYSKIVLGTEIPHISKESKLIYNDFAFMNFFQMPSLYYGLKYWNSIRKSAVKLGDKALSSKLWDKCVESSGETLDNVIEIINPKVIMFTSISAYDAYRDYKNRQGIDIDADFRYIRTSHPSSPVSWNKALKSLSGKTGQEVLEERLSLIVQKKCDVPIVKM